MFFSLLCIHLVTEELKISLETVLVFFTGADSVPPLGYPTAFLRFHDDSDFPTASTCAISLTLPIKHEHFTDFKRSMDIALSMHGGFGKM